MEWQFYIKGIDSKDEYTEKLLQLLSSELWASLVAPWVRRHRFDS